jgi:hypothetical protein
MADTVGLAFEGVRKLWGGAEARIGGLMGRKARPPRSS